MPEIATLVKCLLGIGGGALSWWLNDLRTKQNRVTLRTDAALEKISHNSERLTRLESETITEVESARQLAEMERRIMDSFNGFRLEFKGDLTKFRDDLKDDLKEFKAPRK